MDELTGQISPASGNGFADTFKTFRRTPARSRSETSATDASAARRGSLPFCFQTFGHQLAAISFQLPPRPARCTADSAAELFPKEGSHRLDVCVAAAGKSEHQSPSSRLHPARKRCRLITEAPCRGRDQEVESAGGGIKLRALSPASNPLALEPPRLNLSVPP